jgi:hypothetical protein
MTCFTVFENKPAGFTRTDHPWRRISLRSSARIGRKDFNLHPPRRCDDPRRNNPANVSGRFRKKEMAMGRRIVSLMAIAALAGVLCFNSGAYAQTAAAPAENAAPTADNAVMLTIFLKHDQSRPLSELNAQLDKQGCRVGGGAH